MLIIVTDPEVRLAPLAPDRLVADLDLTFAEARVAAAAGQALPLKDVAGRPENSPNTVKTHLQAIHEKLGVRSQVQLVRLLMARHPLASGRGGSPTTKGNAKGSEALERVDADEAPPLGWARRRRGERLYGRGHMSKRDDLIALYARDLKEKCGVTPDMDLLTKVTIGCGPSIYNADSSTVAGSSTSELETVRTKFLMGKLGLADGPELMGGIQSVIDVYGRSNSNKYRAVVYYLLTKHFGRESVYG